MKIAVEIGEQIRTVRARLGMTATEAADKAGISQPMWSRIERGASKPRAETVAKIERALGVRFEPEDTDSYVLRLYKAAKPAARERAIRELVMGGAVPDRSFESGHEAALAGVR